MEERGKNRNRSLAAERSPMRRRSARKPPKHLLCIPNQTMEEEERSPSKRRRFAPTNQTMGEEEEEGERRSLKKKRGPSAAPKDLLFFLNRTPRRLFCCPSRLDRISALPVDIRLHILSFLTTKSAVKMGVLSKRWARLWTSSPVLRFDQQEFVAAAGTTSFVNFVDRALARRRHGGSITRFELWWKHGFSISKAEAWLRYAISRNVQELVLSMWSSRQNPLIVPHNIFCCPSLQHLVVEALESPAAINEHESARVRGVPSSMSLSKLRILRLQSIIADPGFLTQLTSNCPLLESLKIAVQGHGAVHINAPNLWKLALRWDTFEKYSSIRISAPRLQILYYDFTFHIPDITLEELPSSLASACICCSKKTDGNDAKLLRILTGLRNTKTQALVLKIETIQILSPVPALPKHMSSAFCCLRYLELEALVNEDNIRIIIILLKSFITVEKLVIGNSRDGKFPSSVNGLEDGWFPHKSDYDCSVYNLKEIEFNGFLGARDEVELVNLLLRSTNTLRSMILNYRKELRDQETWMEISRNLLIIPRASSTAEVLLSAMA